MSQTLELLLSLPATMCRQLVHCTSHPSQITFATHDPTNAQLGSGGGTAHLLHEAWKHSRENNRSVHQWVDRERRIVIHGGGESRRLPAYASVGKLFIPIPALRWARGQRLGQTLLDLNEPFLRTVFAQAGPAARLMIASGDVLLRANERVSNLPDADVVLLGMWTAPEVAQNYGVMFCDRHDPGKLVTFLQKPTADEIRERSREKPFLIDIGVWLLSKKAVYCLLTKCGWKDQQATFGDSLPDNYDLYGQWALHLGKEPQVVDKKVSKLSVAVAPIRNGEFYHFGTTNDVIESMYALQNVVQDQTKLGAVPSLAQPKQFIQDSFFGVPVRRQENDTLWVENSHISHSWNIGSQHMLTGVPVNDWHLHLPDGVCLDFTPIGDKQVAIRPYGFSDRFRGAIDNEKTQWLEEPASAWFANRSIDWQQAGIAPATDIQLAPIFPVVDRNALSGDFVQWLVGWTTDMRQEKRDAQRSAWYSCQRLSAREIGQQANLRRLYDQRLHLRQNALPIMARHGVRTIFYKLDLSDIGRTYAESDIPLPPAADDSADLMLAVHDRMFRSEVLKRRGQETWRGEENSAFRLMERAIVSQYQGQPVTPQYQLAKDQIVWARSPARVDLAGGWTDTPPYCVEQGGSVVNIALNLNGQPPIQAFARRCDETTITIRSIDLGLSETLTTYEDIGKYRGIGSGFSVAKAALSLSGFHPDFNGNAFDSLSDQLEQFGGGVDLSMLAAIPQGSGLGTSSILAGTVLGALSDFCGFRWDKQTLAARVSAVEQMLGSGGGWQDQLGGLLPGAKHIETQPGLSQQAAVRWLPADFFKSPEFESRSLLYYTGITRVAHDVLGEVVRGMFLNDPARLSVLKAIGENSHACFDAVQRFNLSEFAHSIQASWELNQALDSGTNPPEVADLVDRVSANVSALKLAGAGGGGFIYMIAKDADHARKLQSDLEENSPNERARFVAMSISSTGMQITRS